MYNFGDPCAFSHPHLPRNASRYASHSTCTIDDKYEMSLSYVKEDIGMRHRLEFPEWHSSFKRIRHVRRKDVLSDIRSGAIRDGLLFSSHMASVLLSALATGISVKPFLILDGREGFPWFSREITSQLNGPIDHSFLRWGYNVRSTSTYRYRRRYRARPMLHDGWAKRGRRGEEDENEDDVSTVDVQVYETHTRKSFL